MANDPNQASVFDPARETAAERIRILNLPDGGTEFILPALRNIRVKITFTLFWLFLAGFIGAFAFFFERYTQVLPNVLALILASHFYYFLGFILLCELALSFAVLDMWLRSSRIVARPGSLQVMRRWLLVWRKSVIPVQRIIELRADDNTSMNDDHYFDIVVLTAGDGMGWLASWLYTRKPLRSDLPANEIKRIQTGGKKLALATMVRGKDEAMWLLVQIRAAAGIEV